MTKNQSTSYDIIIVGGGMVGAVLANALANSPISVAIIDQRQSVTTWEAQNFDLRVSAITRATQQILASVGVWDTIQKMRVSPFREMHVWDATGSGVIHFDSAEIGESCLGHIVENSVIQSALLEHLDQFDNITQFFGSKPQALNCEAQSAQLQLENQSTLSANLIVGADGANSWVRQAINIPVSARDYHQTAVVGTVKTEKFHQETAWQRFMPTGPLAFLPLADGYSSIVWSTTPEHADEIVNMPEHEFKLALADAFDHKLGAITETSKLASFPLKSQHATSYVKPRLALIGDAAHTIHPLAGQGANLGFADAASLAEVILDCANSATENKPCDVGNYQIIRRYERWRKGDNLAMLTSMSAFKYLFSNQQPVLRALRNVGLTMMNNATPAKNRIIRQAMGLVGDLPKLARRESPS